MVKVRTRTNTRRTIANVDLGPLKAQGMALAASRGTNLTELLKELLAARVQNILKNPRMKDAAKRYRKALRDLED